MLPSEAVAENNAIVHEIVATSSSNIFCLKKYIFKKCDLLFGRVANFPAAAWRVLAIYGREAIPAGATGVARPARLGRRKAETPYSGPRRPGGRLGAQAGAGVADNRVCGGHRLPRHGRALRAGAAGVSPL